VSLPYSHVFLRAKGLNGVRTFQVPHGMRAIVINMDFYTGVGAGTEIHVLDDITGGTWYFAIPVGALQQHDQWTGRQVFDEGESFSVHVDGDSRGTDIRVSGYLLSM